MGRVRLWLSAVAMAPRGVPARAACASPNTYETMLSSWSTLPLPCRASWLKRRTLADSSPRSFR